MIRQLVAGAIGCKPTDISVADLNSDRTYPGGGTGSVGGGDMLDNVYGAAKRMYEKDWEEKIRDALSFIPTAKIKVNVELNPEIDVQESEKKYDPKSVPLDEWKTRAPRAPKAAPGGRGRG